MNSACTMKDKRATSRWVGETEKSSRQKFHSGHGNPQLGEISKMQNFSLQTKGFVPTLGIHPVLEFCIRKKDYQNVCFENPQGVCPGDPKHCGEWRFHWQKLIHPGTSIKPIV